MTHLVTIIHSVTSPADRKNGNFLNLYYVDGTNNTRRLEMLTMNQIWDIEIIAMRGKAVASVLNTSNALVECPRGDIEMSLYALECYFNEVLKIIETLNTTTAPVATAGAAH